MAEKSIRVSMRFNETEMAELRKVYGRDAKLATIAKDLLMKKKARQKKGENLSLSQFETVRKIEEVHQQLNELLAVANRTTRNNENLSLLPFFVAINKMKSELDSLQENFKREAWEDTISNLK